MENYRYLSASNYFKTKYGKSFQRLPVDAGFFCPGRCIYCSTSGSLSPVQASLLSDIMAKENLYNFRYNIQERKNIIKLQIDEYFKRNSDIVRFYKNGLKRKKLLYLYFQAFTNTYDKTENLAEIYDYALSLADFDGIFLGTRPDCLQDDVVDLLFKYSKKYDLWIELGLQTIHDRTLNYINRMHDKKSFQMAVEKLQKNDIKVIAHVILGLLDERAEENIETTKFISNLSINGVKFHNLYIMKNTEILKYYERGIQKVLSYEDYIDRLSQCIRYLKSDIAIFRLFSDFEPGTIAPVWDINKTLLIRRFEENLEQLNINQGML
jgi:radical SAM protein (TIGR01212 family)